MRPVCLLVRTKNLRQSDGLHFISDSLRKEGLLHERPYRLAALATSPVLTGEAKMPSFQPPPCVTGEGDRVAVEGALVAIPLT